MEILKIIQERFEKNKHLHKEIAWAQVEKRLLDNKDKWSTLQKMEETGGEVDVVFDGQVFDNQDGFWFVDCSAQSPEGRRSICYDPTAWEKRKEHKPQNSAEDGSAWGLAKGYGCQLLTEEQFLALQKLGDFDTKSQSWLDTPKSIRDKGGAIWGDKSYGRAFICYNGADSYYRVRAFRGCIKI
ncbi:MAG: DUF4256 domain-containing protein [Firmicutes bacterium]|nr:DUF4256 domain-containing protein [Bacillota bacterium]